MKMKIDCSIYQFILGMMLITK